MILISLHSTGTDRLTLRFEDGSEIRSSLGVVTDLRLFRGKDLSEEEIEELKLLSHRSLARDRAIELASRRQMSEKELRDKMVQKGEDRDTAAYCAAWLAENGLLNDEHYAASVARHYAARGYGAGRVKTELSRRGISRDYWEEALEELPAENPKIDKFIASRLSDPADRDQVRKVAAALYRRGFRREEINAALERFEAEMR